MFRFFRSHLFPRGSLTLRLTLRRMPLQNLPPEVLVKIINSFPTVGDVAALSH